MRSIFFASIIAMSALASFSSIASATILYAPYPPIVVQQPAGQWIPVNRPYLIGQALFGPVWVFIPNQPNSLPPNSPGNTTVPLR